MVFLARKNLFLAYNPLFLALFRQIQSITFRQKQAFAKILCGRRTHFSYMQILIFPLPPPYSITSSPPFPPSFPLLFPNFFYGKGLGNLSERLLKFQKNLSEKSPRKHFLPHLLPKRAKAKVPENPLFLGFLKGWGGRCLKR